MRQYQYFPAVSRMFRNCTTSSRGQTSVLGPYATLSVIRRLSTSEPPQTYTGRQPLRDSSPPICFALPRPRLAGTTIFMTSEFIDESPSRYEKAIGHSFVRRGVHSTVTPGTVSIKMFLCNFEIGKRETKGITILGTVQIAQRQTVAIPSQERIPGWWTQ
ncbi:hypothetical protein BDM02DRAFT_2835411 [Thelephora ganbajun]|uniref:Uncharacterized protein n=1 Tax=Thelephora ganbajun TaxID=370292 RepID=A0ACB6ZBL7_THEGA|nr:hypothetical protein BDM02DRAFT_2835411 [Thelephora ganbajun]